MVNFGPAFINSHQQLDNGIQGAKATRLSWQKSYGIICKVANKKSLCECAKSAQKPKVAGRQSRQESETATNLH